MFSKRKLYEIVWTWGISAYKDIIVARNEGQALKKLKKERGHLIASIISIREYKCDIVETFRL